MSRFVHGLDGATSIEIGQALTSRSDFTFFLSNPTIDTKYIYLLVHLRIYIQNLQVYKTQIVR